MDFMHIHGCQTQGLGARHVALCGPLWQIKGLLCFSCEMDLFSFSKKTCTRASIFHVLEKNGQDCAKI